MFDYSENDIYERTGVSEIFIGDDMKDLNGTFINEDGNERPIIDYLVQSGICYSKCLCLKTFRGYIPIDLIKEFWDIFHGKNYLSDEMISRIGYKEAHVSKGEEEKVKRLGYVMGSHWKKK